MPGRGVCSCVLGLVILMAGGRGSVAQIRSAGSAALRVSVLDSGGGAIIAARVRLSPGSGSGPDSHTNEFGLAILKDLPPGSYDVHIEADGFESQDLKAVTLDAGNNQLEVRLEVARVKENITITQDSVEKLTDPRGTAFTNILTEEQIAQLPDDPDEFEAALRQMAGPNAIIRVNGFTGGRLPPKSQIREIRFRLNPYAAENHDASLVGVDIFTKPGADKWHGTFNFGFRDQALNARNTFASIRGPEQYRRFGLDLDGPVWRGRTSLFLSAQGSLAFDSQTIVAALPGGAFSALVQRPTRTLNLSVRAEHSLTRTHTLRVEYQRNAALHNELGVGDFDLPDRAYFTNALENLVRLSDTGLITHRLVNEFRSQMRWQTTESHSATDAPAILVLNAFNSGGAQVQTARRIRDLELADNVDFAIGQHSMRTGFLFDSSTYHSQDQRNMFGTFTFPSLGAFRAGLPTTFTQRTGDPFVAFTENQFGWFFQDDMRLRKNLSLSLGLRHELQSHLDDHDSFAPRLAVAWSPFGKTTLRAGAGLFYQWFDPDTLEQTLRVDGRHQHDTVVLNPGFPNPFALGTQIALPASRIQTDPAIKLPYVEQVSMGAERLLSKGLQLRVNYVYQHGIHLLRSHNINAPLPGIGRPDVSAGNIIQVESTATSSLHLVNVNVARFSRRFYWLVNYSLARQVNDADSPLSLPANNYDLRAERGPSLDDSRHRAFAIMNVRIISAVRLGTIFSARSATPYNITTGFDNNGDSVSNDRPVGIGRNSARGAGQWDLSARLSWGFGFGQASESAGGKPNVIRTKGDADALGAMAPSEGINNRWRAQLYLQVYNLFNHANLASFTGVQTSPFFGHATAALPGRRLETGLRFSF